MFRVLSTVTALAVASDWAAVPPVAVTEIRLPVRLLIFTCFCRSVTVVCGLMLWTALDSTGWLPAITTWVAISWLDTGSTMRALLLFTGG